jgi:hypothetical protein
MKLGIHDAEPRRVDERAGRFGDDAPHFRLQNGDAEVRRYGDA